MLLLRGLNSREAARVGTALADCFFLQAESEPRVTDAAKSPAAVSGRRELEKFLKSFLGQVDDQARPLRLNIFKRAVIANCFKWRLLEKGVERRIVGELTQALVVRLSGNQAQSAAEPPDVMRCAATPARRSRANAELLLAQADQCAAQGAWAEAVTRYQELLALEPRHAVAHNNLGAAHVSLGRYHEAEEHFRRAIALRATYADAHCNLGTVLRGLGRVAESETPLRHALRLKPTDSTAQVSLGTTLLMLGCLRDARDLFEKVLKLAPRHVAALAGLGQVAAFEGRIAEAETALRRALELDPHAPTATAALVRLRRMTPADRAWLKVAEATVSRGLSPQDEADVRYAIGKYYDDVGEYARAFRSYQRANELQKAAADPYDRDAHRRLVDDLIRTYTREALAAARTDASDSVRPVFVAGMPRSGTSLVEQIIASHPAAAGAGELRFWPEAMRKRERLRHELPGETVRRKLAGAYLHLLSRCSAEALRVVDKTPFNSDHLGVIHSVFPQARMIYLRRDPIDSCLSCYFQPFSVALNFSMDLSDLSHYYREHQRLMAHWRSVLPAGTILDVPYAELVGDQEEWSRRIVAFIGLEWDARCLEFHKTDRTVLTASYWQVRQEIYRRSAGRWRSYEKFIGPLLELRDADS